MSDTLNLANSIWPNGMKVDSDGHAVFYPLGTKKIKVPTSSSEWPKGDTLISPYVYQDDKLVGFVDTKALTTDSQTTIYLPYEHIEAEFSAINKGKLQIHAPNAITKKASWKDSGVEDIPEAQLKYKGCKTVDNVKTVDASYKTTDIVDGVWSEPLWDLEQGGGGGEWNAGMFSNCFDLISFTSDLPSLKDANRIFDTCTNLTSFNCNNLSNLNSGYKMFSSCFELNSFNAVLPSLTNGEYMFYYCSNLKSFNVDLTNLSNGKSMFSGCENLTSFKSDLSSLSNGYTMFYKTNLSQFTSDLPSLTNGDLMFQDCVNLTSFSSKLPSLTDGNEMFKHCENLTSFSSDLPSLTDGESMFLVCSNLTSFSSKLPSLTNGSYMFDTCTNLTSFSSNLPSLTNGFGMFSICKLDAPSVKNIIDTINTYSGSLTLGMGCNDTTNDKNLFAQEVGYADMTSLLAALQAKGWTVTAQYNGRPTTTYGLRRPTEDTLPVFVKIEEVDGEVITINQATHTNEDGSMSYRLTWFHETTGSTDGYTQFNSIEEAIETLNIKPIENQ